jgi:hypothetical protein
MKRTGALLAIALSGFIAVGIAVAGLNDNWSTHLKGKFEVPARDTNAQGQAIFQLSDDGNSVSYKLIASNIFNVVQAHIHCGGAGVNGPIVVWLYPSVTARTPLTGPQPRTDGVLAEGSFATGDVIPRAASATCPTGVANLADVLALLNSGGAYVNIHTNDNVAPADTGPGDFPGGEVRGQVD